MAPPPETRAADHPVGAALRTALAAHGDPARLLALCGLDAAGIGASIRQRFGSRPSLAAVNA